jgi:hypothetical protein
LSKRLLLTVLVLCTFSVFLALKLRSHYQPPKDRLHLASQYMDQVGAQESVYGIYIQNGVSQAISLPIPEART